MKKWLIFAAGIVGFCLLACLLAPKTREEPAIADWGVTISVKSATPTGCTLRCSRLFGEPQGELITGEPFWLERREGDAWVDLPGGEEISWVMPAYPFVEGESFELTCNWESMYGALEPGLYRVGKTVTDNLPGSDDETRTYYALFLLEAPSADAVDLGIEMYMTRLVPERRCTVALRQLEDSTAVEPFTGGQFIGFSKLVDGSWTVVPVQKESAFTALAYIIPKDEPLYQSWDWSERYGELTSGIYRVGKDISDRRGHTQYCYVYFEIPE